MPDEKYIGKRGTTWICPDLPGKYPSLILWRYSGGKEHACSLTDGVLSPSLSP
jgi:hypothetical protein